MKSSEDSEGVPHPSAPVWVGELTWVEIAGHIDEGACSVLLPLGATEQHGPHLPCNTDTRRAVAIAERVCRRFPGRILLAPCLPIGVSDEHRGFPGLVGVSESTFVAMLSDVAARLQDWGVTRLILMTAHGGNWDSVNRAAACIRRSMSLEVAVPYGVPGRRSAAEADGLAPDVLGLHAGEAETSEMLAIDSFALRADPVVGVVGNSDVLLDAMSARPLIELSPSGVIGDATQADSVRGSRYLEGEAIAIVDQLSRPETWRGET